MTDPAWFIFIAALAAMTSYRAYQAFSHLWAFASLHHTVLKTYRPFEPFEINGLRAKASHVFHAMSLHICDKEPWKVYLADIAGLLFYFASATFCAFALLTELVVGISAFQTFIERAWGLPFVLVTVWGLRVSYQIIRDSIKAARRLRRESWTELPKRERFELGTDLVFGLWTAATWTHFVINLVA